MPPLRGCRGRRPKQQHTTNNCALHCALVRPHTEDYTGAALTNTGVTVMVWALLDDNSEALGMHLS